MVDCLLSSPENGTLAHARSVKAADWSVAEQAVTDNEPRRAYHLASAKLYHKPSFPSRSGNTT